MTKKDWQQLGKGLAFLSPWLVGFTVFTGLPIALSFWFSLCDYTLLQKPVYVGLENYRTLIWGKNSAGGYGDPWFWKSLWNTARFAAVFLPAAMVVSLGLAMLLNLKIKGQAFYRTIIFLPSLVPAVASAMVWLWIYNADYKQGLINAYLIKLGLDPVGFLALKEWAMYALVFMSLWGVGNTVIIYLAGLQDVPRELYEAAEIDGAGIWRRLWHVTIPMVSPVIFFNLIMGIIGSLQTFSTPYILTDGFGRPERSLYFFAMYLYDNAFQYLKMGHASAMSWIMLVIILIFTGIAFWTSSRWVHYQGK
ncbi:MAG: sugar ABC transporter permease [Planctomycetota bacterium]|nr:sugar ABC transporter permease [Planctomycetota bacterium]